MGGYNGDGIPATTAQLNNPSDVEVALDGAIYIPDLRLVSAASTPQPT